MTTMTPQQIELVKSTVSILREHGVALTTYFYNRMLNNHPELKNTFNMDSQTSGRQPKALATAVLAYAENIENPSVLAKAIERITTKHVSLNIQPNQYEIVGENLLHSISEVLNVPMESDLIDAWKAAYLQLAAILIDVEKAKYQTLSTQTGGWAGWRNFVITEIQTYESGKIIKLKPQNGDPILAGEAGDIISVRVKLAEYDLLQPQQFKFENQQNDQYQINVKNEDQPSVYSVQNTLIKHYRVGDSVQISAPVKL